MSKTKGAGFDFLKRTWKKSNPALEDDFLKNLSPEETYTYKTALPVSWIDVQLLSAIFEKAAVLLFSEHKIPLREFGRLEAHDHLTGVYKLFVKFSTVPFLIKQTAKIWGTYYDHGVAHVEYHPNKKQAVFIVDNYPDLPLSNLEITAGYLIGTLEITGATNIEIEIDSQNPNSFRWYISWT